MVYSITGSDTLAAAALSATALPSVCDCAQQGTTNNKTNIILTNLFTSFSKSTLTMLIVNYRTIKFLSSKLWP